MITFDVHDMTCGHCVSTIARALKSADATAAVEIDLATHQVRVTPSSADASQLAAAIRDAGFSPVLAGAAAAKVAAVKGAGCCGGRH